MIPALAIAVLMSPSFWMARGETAIVASADLRPLIDADLRRRLTSGLTTTLVLTLELRDEKNALMGGTIRVARARWDLWHEQISAIIDGPDGSHAVTYASVNLFLKNFARVQAQPVAPAVPRDGRLYRLHARLEVNPLSDAQLARMRRWLAQSPEGASLDPLNGTLLGSFVRFFDNLKPGVAERSVSAVGHPVRGDRMPAAQPPKAPPSAPASAGPPSGSPASAPPSVSPASAPPGASPISLPSSAPPSASPPSAPSSAAPETANGTP
jgi:hypothetical protein